MDAGLGCRFGGEKLECAAGVSGGVPGRQGLNVPERIGAKGLRNVWAAPPRVRPQCTRDPNRFFR